MGDIFEAVKPILYVSRLVGLAPYSVDTEVKSIQISRIFLVFTSILLISYSGVSGYVLYEMIFARENYQAQEYISEANKICQIACGIGVAIIAILLTLIQRNKMMAVIQSLHQINGEMAKLNLAINYDSVRKISLIEISCLIAYFVFLIIHDVFIWSLYNDDPLPSWIAYLSAPVFNFMMECQFIMGALLLKIHFGTMNNYLSKFNDKSEATVGSIKELTESYVNGEETFLGPRMIDQSFVAWDGNFSRFRTNKTSVDNQEEKITKLSKIKLFRKIHSNLCDVKETLNTAFSLQLLGSVAQAFVIITSDLYILFTTINGNSDSESSIGHFTYPIVWSFTHVIELIFVVVTCTKTSKNANETAVVVHKLLARDCESDIRNQLKLFSIQLLHRKISFSACGFFTLDMTLLQAIIGAATTYLVILIQFHSTYSKPTSEPSTTPSIT